MYKQVKNLDEEAYESSLEMFLGFMFGVIPQELVKPSIDDLKELFGKNIKKTFFKPMAKRHGLSLQNLEDLVVMVGAMRTKKNRDTFLETYPSKIIPEFINRHIKGEYLPFRFKDY